jgi:hypothetical protein
MLLLITLTISLGSSLMNREMYIDCHWLSISLLSGREKINLSFVVVIQTYANLIGIENNQPNALNLMFLFILCNGSYIFRQLYTIIKEHLSTF